MVYFSKDIVSQWISHDIIWEWSNSKGSWASATDLSQKLWKSVTQCSAKVYNGSASTAIAFGKIMSILGKKSADKSAKSYTASRNKAIKSWQSTMALHQKSVTRFWIPAWKASKTYLLRPLAISGNSLLTTSLYIGSWFHWSGSFSKSVFGGFSHLVSLSLWTSASAIRDILNSISVSFTSFIRRGGIGVGEGKYPTDWASKLSWAKFPEVPEWKWKDYIPVPNAN